MRNPIQFFLAFFYLLCGGITFASNGKPASSVGSKTGIYTTAINQNKYGSNHNILSIQNDFVFTIEDEDEDAEDRKQESVTRDAVTVFFSFISYNSPNRCKDTFRRGRQSLSVHSSLYIMQRALRI
jgi:hypothetical protein